jgi:ATP-binding cassette subfamily F protein uup
VRLQIDAGERSGRLVAELEGVGKRFGERVVADRVSLRLMRGDRVALIGPNGVGKTTLVRLLLGTLAPDEGTVRLGAGLQVAYFDQLREQLDPERTLAETIAPGSDWIEIAGVRKHVTGYLADFLFPPQRAQAPVRTLSGGERNRLLLARLFARPSNLLVLDEPTNDLDIESLELLEAALAEYAGTLILVTHDRAFMDNVATQSWVAEGAGRWKEYAGGYSDWLALSGRAAEVESAKVQQPRATAGPPAEARSAKATAGPPAEARSAKAGQRLSYMERRELAALPARIESLEKEQGELQSAMGSPDYHRRGGAQIVQDRARLESLEAELAQCFERWAALEARENASD